MLIFDPDPPYVNWCRIEADALTEARCEVRAGWLDRLASEVGESDVFGYVLYQGADEIREPVSRLTSEALAVVERCVQRLPDRNDLTLKLARWGLERCPDREHLLFCDTAFFTGLPQRVSAYAIPYTFWQKGFRRNGGSGLCHEWVWEKVRSDRVRRIVSVFLGNQTNMAAIDGGRPVETTLGFSSVEGIVSARACGDIDPTIVFQLHAKGMSFREIGELLSHRSGFTGMLGRPCTGAELLARPDDPELREVRAMFRYHVLKYLGAFVSVMGGADAIAFCCEEPARAMPFIRELCEPLGFLGVKLRSEGVADAELTAEDSPVSVVCLKFNKWRMIAEKRRVLAL